MSRRDRGLTLRNRSGDLTVEALRNGHKDEWAVTVGNITVSVVIRTNGRDFEVQHREFNADGSLRHSLRELFPDVDDARRRFKVLKWEAERKVRRPRNRQS